jgi:hypothetical protein
MGGILHTNAPRAYQKYRPNDFKKRALSRTRRVSSTRINNLLFFFELPAGTHGLAGQGNKTWQSR